MKTWEKLSRRLTALCYSVFHFLVFLFTFGLGVQGFVFAFRFFIFFLLSCFLIFRFSRDKRTRKLYGSFFLACNLTIFYTYIITVEGLLALFPLCVLVLCAGIIIKKRICAFWLLFSFLWLGLGISMLTSQTAFGPRISFPQVFFAYSLFTLLLFFSGFFRKEYFLKCPKIMLFSFIVIELILFQFSLAFSKANIKDTKKVLKTRFVKPVVLLVEKKRLHALLRGIPPRTLYESCNGKSLFLFLRYAKYGIIKVNKQTKAVQGIFPHGDVGESPFLDCHKRLLYFSDWERGRLLIFQETNLKKPLSIIKVPRCRVDYALVHDNKIFVGCDMGYLRILNEKTQKIQRVIKREPLLPKLYGKDSLLFWADSTVYFYDYVHDKLSPIFNLSGHTQLEGNPEKNLVFLSHPSGYVYFLKAGKKRATLLKKVYLEPFIRYIRYDKKRNLLFVAGFFKGNMYVLDVNKKTILCKFFVGTQVHVMTFSQDKERLYFSSNQGVFYIDLKGLPLKTKHVEKAVMPH